MRAFGRALRGWLVEATAQCEVEIHALHERVALRAQQRRARAVECDVLRQNGAQVTRADPETNLRELDSATVVVDRAREKRLPVVRGEFGGQRALDFRERLRGDAAVIGDRELLLGGADIDLRLERVAVEERRDASMRRSTTFSRRGRRDCRRSRSPRA